MDCTSDPGQLCTEILLCVTEGTPRLFMSQRKLITTAGCKKSLSILMVSGAHIVMSEGYKVPEKATYYSSTIVFNAEQRLRNIFCHEPLWQSAFR